MSARLEVLNPLSHPGWDELVAATGKGSFFHSSHWAKVINESYGYRPVYFALLERGGLKALLPFMEIKSPLTGKRGVSLPFSDYCEPIIPDGWQMDDVIAEVIRFGKSSGWQSMELRGGALSQDVPRSSYYHGHVLDISRGGEAIFSSFHSNTRRNIKKAEKDGIKAAVCSSLDAVRRFYRLNCMTRKLHGLPPQPYRFFEKVYEHIISKGHGTVCLSYYKGTAIAGNVYFHFGQKAIYKYGASDTGYRHLRAGNLAMWEAIRHYSASGCRLFCFGRTEPENDGLLQYKRGWGGKECFFNYYKYDLKRETFVIQTMKIRGLHNKVFANMPIPFLELTGSLLYKHIG